MDDYILSSVKIDEWMRSGVVRVQGVRSAVGQCFSVAIQYCIRLNMGSLLQYPRVYESIQIFKR